MPLTEKPTPLVFEKPASRLFATPGIVRARKSNPWFSSTPGNVETDEEENAFVTCASELSMRGRAKSTSTVEVTSPTCKPIGPRPRSAPRVTSISSTAVVLNPAFEISKRYVPIDSKANRNRPALSLVTVTVSFVPLFTIFINALGTDAPWGSTTLPETEPLDTCAYAICWLTNGTNMITPATNNAKHR